MALVSGIFILVSYVLLRLYSPSEISVGSVFLLVLVSFALADCAEDILGPAQQPSLVHEFGKWAFSNLQK